MEKNINIPKGWKEYRLLDICEVYQPPTIATKNFVENGKYSVYGANGEIGKLDRFNHEEPQVLMACRGASCGAINVSKSFSWINGNAMVVKPNNKVYLSKDFLKYNLLSINKASIITGTAQPQITRQNLKDFKILVCDSTEQSAIVSRIESSFSRLDSGIAALQKVQKQLAVYRQAVLKEAFDGCGEKKERLENLSFFITKGTTPNKTDMSQNSGEIPYIKVYNLTFDLSLDFSITPTFVSKHTHETFLNRSKVLPGDVLMNIVGPPLGKVSIVPDTYPEWNMNQAIVRFRCKEQLNNKFLAFYLTFYETVKSMTAKTKATAGQQNLTLEICRDITIPVPEIQKQKEIVEHIESRLSVCDSIEKTVSESLRQAEVLRQSILKEAFEGRL